MKGKIAGLLMLLCLCLFWGNGIRAKAYETNSQNWYYTVGDRVSFQSGRLESATNYWFEFWKYPESSARISKGVEPNSSWKVEERLSQGKYLAYLICGDSTGIIRKEERVIYVDYPKGEQTIPNGKYQICTALNNSSVVSVEGASKNEEANVILHANDYHDNQVFEFTYLNDGYYEIKAVHSGRCLDVCNGSMEENVNVVQYWLQKSDNQKWVVKKTSDGYYQIQSICNGNYLDVSGGGTANNTNIAAYIGHENKGQKWKLLPCYDVNYNGNGGSSTPSAQMKYNGKTLTLSSQKPTRTGYTFLGWSTSKTATTSSYSAGGSFTRNADTTLYAVWKPNPYTVSYNSNGGSGAPSSQTKYHGSSLTLSSQKPTRTGYTFLGWSTSKTATTASYSAGGSFTKNAATTLYAVWKLNAYTVRYDGNGGSGAPCSQTKHYGKNLTLSSAKPTRTGHTFLGWSTDKAAATAEYNAGGSFTKNAGATLYAVWKLNTYTVRYDGNGGSGAPSSQTKYYGKGLTLSSQKPTWDGHTFLGWAIGKTAAAAEYQPGASYTKNSGETLYAVWKTNPPKPVQKKKQLLNVKTTVTKVLKKNKTFSLGIKAAGKLTFKSSNKKVATVTKNGTVKMKDFGETTITVTAAATSKYYSAKKVIKVKLVPAQPKVTAKRGQGNILEIKWNQIKDASYYEIQCSPKKNFSELQLGRTLNNKVTSVRKDLGTYKKEYYVRIRSVRKAKNGNEYFSPWSKVATVK